MSRSTWYAGPRKTLVERLDIRKSAETGRITLDRAKFLRWLDSLAGAPAHLSNGNVLEATHTTKPAGHLGVDVLVRALAEGDLTDDGFRRAARLVELDLHSLISLIEEGRISDDGFRRALHVLDL